MTKQIFLLGYMGVGKSTAGKALASANDIAFYDLDAVIEKGEGASVRAIFKEYGELYFRKKEYDYLQKLIQIPEQKVVALGGGTPCYFNSMNELNDNKLIKTVYLKASVAFLTQRLWPERYQRPMISHLETESLLTEFIGKHIFDRNPFYLKAEHQLQVEGKSIRQIVTEIQNLT